MFKRLYVAMALYFMCVIAVTLAAVTLLFFFTVGRPLAREVHTMLRSHTRYLAEQVRQADVADAGAQILVRDFDRFRQSYGFDIVLYDADHHPLAATSNLGSSLPPLTDTMTDTLRRGELFVQSSHFGRPLIYVLPVTDVEGERYVLYVSRQFPPNRTAVSFLSGLALIGLLLAAAVYPLSRWITRPLSDLTRDLERLGAGHFDELPHSDRADEIGQLIRGYRAMSQSVHQMIVSKKKLLADISHELCSPLARIRVGTELIRSKTCDPAATRYLTNIDTDIDTLDHLIDMLAVYSRMNLPGFTLSETPLRPADLLGSLRDVYLPLVEARGIHLSLVIPETGGGFSGDGERLKQVFSNLLDNALRFTEPGETITLGVEDRATALCFYVEDPGPGVPESEVGNIFDPLYRVDYSRNRNLGGAGLGLAIARTIVELHGGQLTYTRTNHRTRFMFCLDKTR
jgi:signal transduction histidine kinase